MYEALVARVRYHIQKANFMGLKEAESTLLLVEAADAIEELQADVRPVMRGKWIEDWETGYSECSVCHESFLWEDFKGVADWNYCPNCGARMDNES